MYTAAPLKRMEHPLMRWVGEMEEVRVERVEEVHERAVLQALESQMDSCAEAEEVEDIKEQIRLAMERVALSKGREQLRWIVPSGAEEGHRKEALARARRSWRGSGSSAKRWRKAGKGRGHVSGGDRGGGEGDK